MSQQEEGVKDAVKFFNGNKGYGFVSVPDEKDGSSFISQTCWKVGI